MKYTIGHRCSVKGCGNVLVLDGNMKNARTVCSCNSVGELMFEGTGYVVIGKYSAKLDFFLLRLIKCLLCFPFDGKTSAMKIFAAVIVKCH